MSERKFLPNDAYYAKMQMMRFQAMSPEERLAHFDEVSQEICSDEWRVKIRQFAEQFPSGTEDERPPIYDEVLDHSQAEMFCVDPNADIPGCRACREAIWHLVILTSMDW